MITVVKSAETQDFCFNTRPSGGKQSHSLCDDLEILTKGNILKSRIN